MARRSKAAEGLTLEALARLLGGELDGEPARRVVGVASLEDAGAEEVAFCADRRRLASLPGLAAGVVLVPRGVERPAGGPAIVRVDDPYLAAARVLETLYPVHRAAEGVHPTAVVEARADLGPGVCIGPHAVVGEGAVVGARTEIGAGCVVAPGVRLGADCFLYPNVTLYGGTEVGDRVILHAGVVIGADGFGYARDGGRQVKVPQIGGVLIESDVEIGANSCVDRGTFRKTRIGARTKIDNLVQIGHNCDVGRDCALSGLVGLAGSTVLEDGVIAGGNVGTAGHQRIGAGAMLAAKSGVHGDIQAGAVVGGYPQMEIGLWRRVVASLAKLPELIRRVRRLERELEGSGKE